MATCFLFKGESSFKVRDLPTDVLGLHSLDRLSATTICALLNSIDLVHSMRIV